MKQTANLQCNYDILYFNDFSEFTVAHRLRQFDYKGVPSRCLDMMGYGGLIGQVWIKKYFTCVVVNDASS